MVFKDQVSAGEELAEKLSRYKNKKAVVLAIPRGGVATGSAVAKKLHLPLDVVVAHKISAPGNPELAIGAVGETKGSLWLNKALVSQLSVSDDYLQSEIKKQQAEIKRREKTYRQAKTPRQLKGKLVILVDDGIATGATMIAAVREMRNLGADKVVVAIPVAPPDTVKLLKKEADEVVCLETPPLFFAVGQWYQNFRQYTDQEVIKLVES